MERVMAKAERWRKLEQLLARAPNGVRVKDLAEALEVHRSTVYRDIEQLTFAGLPVWQEEGKVGMLIDRYLSSLRLDLYEALSLFIAIRLLSRHTNERDKHVESLLTKLADILPEPISHHILHTAQVMQDYPNNPDYVGSLEKLIWAWANRFRVRIWYQSAWQSTAKERELDVYFIEPIQDWRSSYVIGLDHHYNEVRTFKIKRIKRIEVTDNKYVIRENLDFFERWANAWGISMAPENSEPETVKLRFSERATHLVKEAVWHHTQHIEDLEEGGCIFSVNVGSVLGMRVWILSWGADVEVLEPPELRNDLIAETQKARALYK